MKQKKNGELLKHFFANDKNEDINLNNFYNERF